MSRRRRQRIARRTQRKSFVRRCLSNPAEFRRRVQAAYLGLMDLFIGAALRPLPTITLPPSAVASAAS